MYDHKQCASTMSTRLLNAVTAQNIYTIRTPNNQKPKRNAAKTPLTPKSRKNKPDSTKQSSPAKPRKRNTSSYGIGRLPKRTDVSRTRNDRSRIGECYRRKKDDKTKIIYNRILNDGINVTKITETSIIRLTIA